MVIVSMLIVMFILFGILCGIGLLILSTIFIIIGKVKDKKVLRILSYIGYPLSVIVLVPSVIIVVLLITRPDLNHLSPNYVEAQMLTVVLEDYDNDGYNDRILYDESTNIKYIQYRICGDVEIKEKNKYSYQGEYKCYWVNYHSVVNDGGFDMIFTDFEVYFNKEMWINMDQEAEANLFYSTNNRYKLNDTRVPIEFSSIMDTLEDHTLAKEDINEKEAKHIYANKYTCDYTMYSNDYYYEIAEYNDKLYLANYEDDYRGIYYELDSEYTNILKNILDLK